MDFMAEKGKKHENATLGYFPNLPMHLSVVVRRLAFLRLKDME
jgi:hypothetical protein